MAQQRACGVFVHAAMESIPYGADMFDLVTSLYAIQHTEEVAQSILEMIRVAKPGGLIAILAKHPFRNLLESYVMTFSELSEHMGCISPQRFVNTIISPEFCSRLNALLSKPPYVPSSEKPAASWR